MALTVPCATTLSIGLEAFIEHVKRNVDLLDLDSVASIAPLFGALANDRELIVRPLNEQLKLGYRDSIAGLAQSIPLGEGEHFQLRANIWPSMADIAADRVPVDPYTYDNAHDHNYHFMTVGYFGAGYVTEIYEYDYDKVEGYVGEPVDLRFQERTQFTPGRAMLYRASRDLHIQFPPEDLSITLSLMVQLPELLSREQFYFDLQHRTISGFAPNSTTSRRIDIVAMAGQAGNAETCQMLSDLARLHPCRRTRLTAYESLARLLPADALKIWERAADDRAPLVANEARARLAAWRP